MIKKYLEKKEENKFIIKVKGCEPLVRAEHGK